MLVTITYLLELLGRVIRSQLLSFDVSEHNLMIQIPQVKCNLRDQSLEICLTLGASLRCKQWRHGRVILVVAKNVVTGHKNIVRVSSGIASTTNADSLEHTAAPELFDNILWLEVVRDEVIVRLEASDVMRHSNVDS